jgi:CheY-like chemotaxis protein/signal transduction histidine kinase
MIHSFRQRLLHLTGPSLDLRAHIFNSFLIGQILATILALFISLFLQQYLFVVVCVLMLGIAAALYTYYRRLSTTEQMREVLHHLYLFVNLVLMTVSWFIKGRALGPAAFYFLLTGPYIWLVFTGRSRIIWSLAAIMAVPLLVLAEYLPIPLPAVIQDKQVMQIDLAIGYIVLFLFISFIMYLLKLNIANYKIQEKSQSREAALFLSDADIRRIRMEHSELLAGLDESVRNPLHSIIAISELSDSIPEKQRRLQQFAASQLLQWLNSLRLFGYLESPERDEIWQRFDIKKTIRNAFGLWQQQSKAECSIAYNYEDIPKYLNGYQPAISMLIMHMLDFIFPAGSSLYINVQRSSIHMHTDRRFVLQIDLSTSEEPAEGALSPVDPASSLHKLPMLLLEKLSAELLQNNSHDFYRLNIPVRMPEVAPDLDREFGDIGRQDILIVDGDRESQLLYKLYLKGHSIEICSNGESALNALRSRKWDLVIVELRLSDYTGVDLVKKIREMDIPEAGQVPILVVTAWSLGVSRQECIEAGCNDYRTKPITPQGLLAAISQLV